MSTTWRRRWSRDEAPGRLSPGVIGKPNKLRGVVKNHPNRNKTRSVYPPSLARSWVESHQGKPGNTKAEMMRRLNSATGASYNQGRLYQWLTLEREPERETRSHMLRECIPHVLKKNGIDTEKLTPAQLRGIAEGLS